MSDSAQSPERSPALLVVIGSAVASALLALFQWYELLEVRAGAEVFCAVNEQLDCASVWDSPMASAIHAMTGVPVAGWGLVYGLVATVLALRYRSLLAAGGQDDKVLSSLQALRVTALAGVASVAIFGGYSAQLGVFCLTCITTYVLTAVFAGGVLFGLPKPESFGDALVGGAIQSAMMVVAAFLLVIYPGMLTPKSSASAEKDALAAAAQVGGPAGAPAASDKSKAAQEAPDKEAPKPAGAPKIPEDFEAFEKQLASFIISLPMEQQQMMSRGLAAYKVAPKIDASRFQTRHRKGPSEAPMKIVEWIDYLCPHCALLAENLESMDDIVAAESWSLEPRHFPLDSECNPLMKYSDGTGVHCFAAYAMICVEGRDDYFEIQKKMLSDQRSLTKERIMEVATSTGMNASDLTACIESPGTKDKLQDDIDYAALFDVEGTPLVVLNDRKISAHVPLLFALNRTLVDPDNRAFDVLPKPEL